MTDSYSRVGDLSPSNGYANGSSPSLTPSNNAGIAPVIRKKLMGYVGFANLPNQVHRKSVRKGFQFTAMVVGSLFRLFPFPSHFHTILNRRVRFGQVYADQHPLQHPSLPSQGAPSSFG